MTLFTVDGVALPAPQPYDITSKDLDSENSQTGEDGRLTRDVIRFGHLTIAVSWERLKPADYQLIKKAVEKKVFFQLTYFDPDDKVYKTGEFYATDRKTQVLRISNEDRRTRYNLSFSFIER